MAGGLVIAGLLAAGGVYLRGALAGPREAPEVDKVLDAQAKLPFQVLIPAYLPAKFDRKRLEIYTDRRGPQGELMVELVYPARQGGSLVLQEWASQNPEADAAGGKSWCCCGPYAVCNVLEAAVKVGRLRVTAHISSAALLSREQRQYVLGTLGPAANRQVYTTMAEVPITLSLPPAVAVPVNAAGVQELTLVVTPQGYEPAHFSVKKGIPVKLTFRQLGQVGCGNELIFSWGPGQRADVILASLGDTKVIEFTPRQAGDFQFHCPHYIYKGAMTVDH